MKRKKIIRNFNLLSIMVVGLFFFMPKMISAEIDTSSWNLYQNQEYGFELKYPANWAQRLGAIPTEIFLFGESGWGDREMITVGVSEEIGDIERIKQNLIFTTSQRIVNGHEMFCYENATPEEDLTAWTEGVYKGYKITGCFFREGNLSYSISLRANYKVIEKINIFNAMVDLFKLIDKPG